MPDCQACGHPNPDDATTCELCGTPLTSRPGVGGTRLGPDDKSVFEAGDRIADRYLVERVLGQGGMGVVYQARDATLGDLSVVLKLIRPELVAHPEARQRFVQEVTIGLSLTHPSIVRVYDLKERGGLLFFTMEYVEGRSLREWMVERKGQVPPFTLAETAAVISPLLDALEYAHNKTIHRDIKPENIMVTGAFPQVGVKVLDFGIAKTLSASSFTRTAHAMGTAYYMSPEQLAGATDIDLRSDLYSVGMVLYEMLTGRMAVGRFKLPCEIVPDLPADVDDLVDKALASLPADRFQTDTEFRRALKNAVEAGRGFALSAAPEDGKKALTAGRAAAGSSAVVDDPSRKADTVTASPPDLEPELAPQPKAAPKAGQASKESGGPATRSPIKGFAAALLFVLIGLGGWYGYAQFLSKAVLDVTSTPAGATVRVDGQEVGRTPLRLDAFEEGPHQVRLELDRYAPYEGSVILAKGESRSFDGRLEPLPIGDVTIRSTPAGAVVLLDGEEKGETPLTLERLPAGKHEVVLQAEGYDEWRSPVEIVALQPATVEADLATVYGALVVTSEPAGAEVLLDGKKVGVTPSEVETVHKGEHKIELRLADHDSWSETVEIGAGRKNEIAAKLIPIYGGLKVTSTPSKAKILLDGETVGETPLTLDRVGKGKHKLAVRKDEYAPWQEETAVRGGETTKVKAELKMLPAGLKVTSAPSGAQVFLGGQAVGATPLSLDAVAAGRVQIAVEKPCAARGEKEVRLVGGRTEAVHFDLKPTCGSLEISSTPPGATVYVNGKEVGQAPQAIDGLTPGSYTVRFELDGYEDGTTTVDVAAGRKTPASARMKPMAAWTEPTTGIEFVWVPGGCFRMGSNDGDSDERPVHEVCVDGFWMGKYEVTQGEWQKVVGSNPSRFKGARNPVEQVSWEDAQGFIRKLNASGSGPGKYRLPREAEWEYAARSGGKDEKYAGGSDLDRLGWYSSNSGNRAHPVGGKTPNGLGLYDMSGNVWEWCQDWYGRYSSGKVTNPTGPSTGSSRVFRGGSWNFDPSGCRSAIRNGNDPGNRYISLGFRLALSPVR